MHLVYPEMVSLLAIPDMEKQQVHNPGCHQLVGRYRDIWLLAELCFCGTNARHRKNGLSVCPLVIYHLWI